MILEVLLRKKVESILNSVEILVPLAPVFLPSNLKHCGMGSGDEVCTESWNSPLIKYLHPRSTNQYMEESRVYLKVINPESPVTLTTAAKDG